MSHLWIRDLNEWTTRALTGDVFQLPGATPATPSGAVLRRAAAGTPDSGWLLLTAPTSPARVNGEPVPLGIRALRDKDEIRLPGAAAMFFSTEQPVVVEPFAGAAQGKCPRCARPIEPNSPAARCGGCQTWYHQSDARACLTYGDHPICVACGADAVVNGEFNWVPEDI